MKFFACFTALLSAGLNTTPHNIALGGKTISPLECERSRHSTPHLDDPNATAPLSRRECLAACFARARRCRGLVEPRAQSHSRVILEGNNGALRKRFASSTRHHVLMVTHVHTARHSLRRRGRSPALASAFSSAKSGSNERERARSRTQAVHGSLSAFPTRVAGAFALRCWVLSHVGLVMQHSRRVCHRTAEMSVMWAIVHANEICMVAA